MKRSGEMSGLFLLNKFGQSGKKSGWKPQNCLTLQGFRVIYILPKTKGVLIIW